MCVIFCLHTCKPLVMSQAGLIEIVASQQSPQITPLMPWPLDLRLAFGASASTASTTSMNNNECTLSTQPTGTRAGQRLTFRVSKAGDWMTSCWLECVAPKLFERDGGLVSYVHALGYAMIQSVQFMVATIAKRMCRVSGRTLLRSCTLPVAVA